MDNSENNSKNCEGGQINFKQKKTRKKIRRVIYTTLFIGISLTSGAIAADYIVEMKYGDKLKYLCNNYNSKYYTDDYYELNRRSNNVYKISDLVDSVGNYVVGVSKNEDSFTTGNNSDKNGTGIIVDEDGYIATNYNTIKDFKDSIYVKLSNRGTKPIKGTIVSELKDLDIVILKIDINNLRVPNIKEVSNIKVGDNSILIGNSLAQENSAFMTKGIICGSSDKVIEEFDGKKSYKIIKTDAVVNASNNGGVLSNDRGEFIGINSMELSKTMGENGKLYTSISISDVAEYVDRLKEYNGTKSPDLGIVGDGVVKEYGDVDGVYVLEFLPGSPLLVAGLKPTDIITEIEGKHVKNLKEVNDILSTFKFGNEIEIKVLRNGQNEKCKVKLEKYQWFI